MADTYGVTPDDIGSEIPALFGPAMGGFTAATSPSSDSVRTWIASADVVVTLAVRAATSGVPSTTDAAAPLARRYIVVSTLADTLTAIYAGRDPVSVAQAVKPYRDQATLLLQSIRELGKQAEGDGATVSRVRFSTGNASGTGAGAGPLVTDDQLGAGARRSTRF